MKILAYFTLLFFSIHIFEPVTFFKQSTLLVFENHTHPAGDGHGHDTATFGHNHPCCTTQTVDSTFYTPQIIVSSLFGLSTVEWHFSAAILYLLLRFFSRAPPQFTFSR